MTLQARLSAVFGLRGPDSWRRHANPWSVYTRIPITVALALAVWSRVWLGWWALVPVAAVVVWTAVNPRVFPAPRTLDSWASRAVLGETYWGERKVRPVPRRHRTAPLVLGALSAAGVPFLVWGLVVYDPWLTAFGVAVQTAGKLWFMDRMALLCDDMADTDAGR
ncbi:hypothetical protein H7I41_07175 [Mycobacterium manitobense]|uniref:Uncharacterized protein n=1 Tax=[Mycobacterium] manitobense TaxID=190147 RepID=A0A9X2Y848_9MYCO|nr:DUF6653 family protein [[Mycobacterium] manitobense]MCV7169703.1 hypothetical protein [[Mycobacterium] manitobense]